METAERLCHDILLINKSKKVVGGSLREVKESYGRNLIALRVTGGEAVLSDRRLVAAIEDHADERYVELTDGADGQALLWKLVDSGAVVSKFEEVEPSLNDIFIEQVGGVR
jgi:ABC-2 type transport system ATP-binding protein